MIRAIVAAWALVVFVLVVAAVWSGNGSTSDHLGQTAFFVVMFGFLAGLGEAGRRDLMS